MSPEELMAVINVVADTAMEAYYWWATAIMIAIHAGFMMYEMGASRSKNVMHTGVKNILAFAFTIPAFFVVGFWAYWAYLGPTLPTSKSLDFIASGELSTTTLQQTPHTKE